MLLLNKTLLRFAKGLWGYILAIVAVRMVTLVCTAGFAADISSFLGNFFVNDLSPAEVFAAIRSALILAVILLVSDLARGELEFRCTAKARTRLRTEIFDKVLQLDAGNIEKIGPVSAITSSVDAVESMQSYYSMYLPGLVYCLVAPFYLFARMYSSSAVIATALFFVSLILLPLNNVFRSKIEELKTDYWNSLEDLTSCYLEGIRGLTTLKLFRRDEERTGQLTVKADHFCEKVLEVMKVNFSSFLLSEGIIYLTVAGCMLTACLDLKAGKMDLSSALMVLMLSYSFFAGFKTLMSATHSALAGVSAADKVERIMAIDSSRPYDPAIAEEEEYSDGIFMKNVNYSYEGRKQSLSDISLHIEKGKTTALVGLSGCGKSTAAGLLMRFFDPSSGKMYLEGKDYISFTPQQLRKRIIMVPQSVSIFSGTIRDNLRIADEQASDAEMMEVLDLVHLGDFVRDSADGLGTDVGDAGAKLSGGQKQKIGIARALLAGADYIIFDEATSAVDTVSEQDIWDTIGKLAKTRTLILISHRMATIRNADRIYVLSGGQAKESGTHEELMAMNGLYHQLVTEQEKLG